MTIRGSIAEAELRILAESLSDFEDTRIATVNRLRAMRQVYGIEEGVEPPEVARLQSTIDGLKKLERICTLDLERAMRRHPLNPWVQSTVGIGTKQGARLIGAIGDPYWNGLHDRPRTVAELHSYCGYAPENGQARTRRKGQKANWNAEAKMRTFLCAESCVMKDGEPYEIKNGPRAGTIVEPVRSPYRDRYEKGREQYADAIHKFDCVRCGPKGNPAKAGSELSDGHKYGRAVRLVCRDILEDLWNEARRITEG